MGRPRTKLTDAEVLQVESMIKSGSSEDQIIDFLKQTYNVSITPAGIKQIKRESGLGASGSKKKSHHRRSVPRLPVAVPEPELKSPLCLHAEVCKFFRKL